MRLRAGCAWIVIVTMLITSTAHARPSVGRAGGGGGGGRPAASRPAAKPQMPQSRPQARPQAMPQSRPQMPAARPNMPSNVQRPVARPGTMGAGGGVGGMARPQTPNFQRPSVGSMQRPNASRPSLPNATTRPQPSGPLAGATARPGLGSIRPGGGAGSLPGNVGLPGNGGRPSAGLTKPAPQPGLSGLGGSNATRPGGGFANRPGPGPNTKPRFPSHHCPVGALAESPVAIDPPRSPEPPVATDLVVAAIALGWATPIVRRRYQVIWLATGRVAAPDPASSIGPALEAPGRGSVATGQRRCRVVWGTTVPGSVATDLASETATPS